MNVTFIQNSNKTIENNFDYLLNIPDKLSFKNITRLFDIEIECVPLKTFRNERKFEFLKSCLMNNLAIRNLDILTSYSKVMNTESFQDLVLKPNESIIDIIQILIENYNIDPLIILFLYVPDYLGYFSNVPLYLLFTRKLKDQLFDIDIDEIIFCLYFDIFKDKIRKIQLKLGSLKGMTNELFFTLFFYSLKHYVSSVNELALKYSNEELWIMQKIRSRIVLFLKKYKIRGIKDFYDCSIAKKFDLYSENFNKMYALNPFFNFSKCIFYNFYNHECVFLPFISSQELPKKKFISLNSKDEIIVHQPISSSTDLKFISLSTQAYKDETYIYFNFETNTKYSQDILIYYTIKADNPNNLQWLKYDYSDENSLFLINLSLLNENSTEIIIRVDNISNKNILFNDETTFLRSNSTIMLNFLISDIFSFKSFEEGKDLKILFSPTYTVEGSNKNNKLGYNSKIHFTNFVNESNTLNSLVNRISKTTSVINNSKLLVTTSYTTEQLKTMPIYLTKDKFINFEDQEVNLLSEEWNENTNTFISSKIKNVKSVFKVNNYSTSESKISFEILDSILELKSMYVNVWKVNSNEIEDSQTIPLDELSKLDLSSDNYGFSTLLSIISEFYNTLPLNLIFNIYTQYVYFKSNHLAVENLGSNSNYLNTILRSSNIKLSLIPSNIANSYKNIRNFVLLQHLSTGVELNFEILMPTFSTTFYILIKKANFKSYLTVYDFNDLKFFYRIREFDKENTFFTQFKLANLIKYHNVFNEHNNLSFVDLNLSFDILENKTDMKRIILDIMLFYKEILYTGIVLECFI